MRVLTTSDTMVAVAEKLQTGTRFQFTRFGDGDFFLMNGGKDRSHKNSDELAKEEQESVQICDPNYLKALSLVYPTEPGMEIGVFAPHRCTKEIWVIAEKFLPGGEDLFYNPVAFAYWLTFRTALFKDFLDTFIVPLKKIFIGCEAPEVQQLLFGNVHASFPVPRKNAYYTLEDWWDRAVDVIMGEDIELIVFCAGSATRALQKRLYHMQGCKATSIDFGSVVEPFSDTWIHTWVKRKGDEIVAAWKELMG